MSPCWRRKHQTLSTLDKPWNGYSSLPPRVTVDFRLEACPVFTLPDLLKVRGRETGSYESLLPRPSLGHCKGDYTLPQEKCLILGLCSWFGNKHGYDRHVTNTARKNCKSLRLFSWEVRLQVLEIRKNIKHMFCENPDAYEDYTRHTKFFLFFSMYLT